MFFRKPSDHVPHVTIFHTILRSMLWILFIEIALLVGILYLCRINTNLEQNAVDILQIQTENRQNYLQGQMLDAQDLSSLAGKINAVTQAMLDDGEISLDTLDSGSDAASPLLLSIGDSLISSMRHRPVTGIFVVLNTHDLDTRKKGEPLPCLYLRDLDPNSSPSQRNSDLMLVRAPAQVVQSLYIATDTSWTPSINYGANGSSGFLYPVFQAAYHGNGELDAADYGHWTSSPYTLSGDDHSAIAYTIPLILDDGTVYGVLGVEILESYLQALLPGTELQNDSSGTYLLGVASNSAIGKDDLTVSVISASPAANAPQQSYDQTLLLKPSKRGGYQSDSPLGLCHAAVAPLTLYNRNAPFSNEQMLLIGSDIDAVGSGAQLIAAELHACHVHDAQKLGRSIEYLASELRERGGEPVELDDAGGGEHGDGAAAFTRVRDLVGKARNRARELARQHKAAEKSCSEHDEDRDDQKPQHIA